MSRSSYRYFVAALLMAGVSLRSQDAGIADPSPGTLEWHARRATAKGEKTVHLPCPNALFANVEGLDDAMMHTTTVIAQLLVSETTHDSYHIFTWKKFRIIDRLSSQPTVPEDALPSDVPKTLLPLKKDEFLFPEFGGTINIDGVTITADGFEASSAPEGARHLMFLEFSSGGAVAQSNYGSQGLFWIDDADKIHARNEADRTELKTDLFNRTDRRLSLLRGAMRPSPNHY